MSAMKISHLFLIAPLLLAVAGGCGSPRGGVAMFWLLVQDEKGAYDVEHLAVVEDEQLAKEIDISLGGIVEQSGAFKAMNSITSKTSRQLDLEYRVDWLGDDGGVLDHYTVLWSRFTLPPKDMRFLNSNLPGPAAGYRLRVRRQE